MTDLDATPIPSPCRKQCQLHPVDKICLGCFRRIEEIADWARFDGATRERIIAELPTRRRDWETRRARREWW